MIRLSAVVVRLQCLFFGTLIFQSSVISVTPGALDLSFAPNLNGSVNAAVLQLDGKVLIGGGFTTVNNAQRRSLARLNADGSLDATFDPGDLCHGTVLTLLSEANGKILVGSDGLFTPTGDTSPNQLSNRVAIARLYPNGQLDSVFNAAISGRPGVQQIIPQPDGKLLLKGGFVGIGGTDRPHVARVDTYGKVDLAFNAGNLPLPEMIARQPDGKIIVAFSTFLANGFPILERLNDDGSLAPTFTAPALKGRISAVAIHGEGKIIAAGSYSAANNPSNAIMRLNSDGSVETQLAVNISVPSTFAVVVEQPNGKLIVGGSFTDF